MKEKFEIDSCCVTNEDRAIEALCVCVRLRRWLVVCYRV